MGQGLDQRCRPGPPLPGGAILISQLYFWREQSFPALPSPGLPSTASSIYLFLQGPLCVQGFDFQPKIICELWADRGAQHSCLDPGSEADAKP